MSPKLQRVALVTNSIPHYRVPLYNLLAQRFEFTVFHSGEIVRGNCEFSQVRLRCYELGPFNIQPGLLFSGLKRFDSIIYMCDIRWLLSIIVFYCLRRKVRSIWWGAWKTGHLFTDRIRLLLLKGSASNIYYCDNHLSSFFEMRKKNIDQFVANNTVYVENHSDTSAKSYGKNRIISVGSLNQRKRLDLIITAIYKMKLQGLQYFLDLVGSGPQKELLIGMVDGLGLSDNITFHGQITDEHRLMELYSNSFVSVSLGQAGLSVLQSMAYGVPFVTFENAISGGEKTNIINGYNGLLLPSGELNDFSEVLLAHHNKDIDFGLLGANAYRTYIESATTGQMVIAFVGAINCKVGRFAS